MGRSGKWQGFLIFKIQTHSILLSPVWTLKLDDSVLCIIYVVMSEVLILLESEYTLVQLKIGIYCNYPLPYWDLHNLVSANAEHYSCEVLQLHTFCCLSWCFLFQFCCNGFHFSYPVISHFITFCSFFTNTLILPIVNGPTEGLMLIYLCHIFTFFTGIFIETVNFHTYPDSVELRKKKCPFANSLYICMWTSIWLDCSFLL